MPLSVQTHYGTMYDAHNDMYMYIYVYIHIYMHTRTHVCMMYIYIYTYIYIYSMRNNAKRAPPGLLARTRTHVLRFLVSSLAFFAFRRRERRNASTRTT